MNGVKFISLLKLVNMIKIFKLASPVSMVFEMILTDLKGTVLDSSANEVSEDYGGEYESNKN